MSYTVFVRNWWISDKSYPYGKRPGPGPKTIIRRGVDTEEEARKICAEYNETHEEGKLSRKAEYQSE